MLCKVFVATNIYAIYKICDASDAVGVRLVALYMVVVYLHGYNSRQNTLNPLRRKHKARFPVLCGVWSCDSECLIISIECWRLYYYHTSF